MKQVLRASTALIATWAVVAPAGIASAQTATTAAKADHAERIEKLEDTLSKQAEALARYQVVLDQYKQELDRLKLEKAMMEERAAGVGPAPAPPGPRSLVQAQAAPDQQQAPVSGAQPVPVGEGPQDERQAPQVSALYDIGGVLTPQGELVFQPGLEYSHASSNRFTFRGAELQQVLLIGVIEASDADRDLLAADATFRYGITDRFEVEARVPYLYRSDELTFQIPVLGEEDSLERTESLEGYGIGDIELAARYQLNSGRDGWPVFVGNLRGKSRTGKGPFDVDRDNFGVEQELPTGSGFYEVEPSITALFRTDPVVLFGNLGYSYRIGDDVNERIGDFIVRDVDPGDAIKTSVGMAFAVNDRFSFSLGYEHSYVMDTELDVFNPATGVTSTQESGTLHIGAFNFGMAYGLFANTNLNLDFSLGVTEDAPDMRAMLRVPIRLGQIF